MVLITKDVFEPSYNDLKFMIQKPQKKKNNATTFAPTYYYFLHWGCEPLKVIHAFWPLSMNHRCS